MFHLERKTYRCELFIYHHSDVFCTCFRISVGTGNSRKLGTYSSFPTCCLSFSCPFDAFYIILWKLCSITSISMPMFWKAPEAPRQGVSGGALEQPPGLVMSRGARLLAPNEQALGACPSEQPDFCADHCCLCWSLSLVVGSLGRELHPSVFIILHLLLLCRFRHSGSLVPPVVP